MDSEKKYDNIILFTNGAIGDFLMGALCADSARKKLSGGEVIIFTPRNAAILQNLFFAYPHVYVLEVSRRNFLQALILLVRLVWQKNIVVNQGVFRKIPHQAQLFARLLTIHRESTYLHFIKKGVSLKHKEKGTIVFDYHLSVYENLAHLFNRENLNIPSTVPPYHFVSDASVLERYDLVHSLYVVVHPCAFSSSRSLPSVRWAEIFAYLLSNFPSMKVVVTGSNQDNLFIQKIFDAGVSPSSVVNLSGKLSMMELANVINGARGYIGVDTGITHLAGVLQKRSVIIGNLSNPCWLPVYNKNATILTERKSCTCNGEKGGDCFYLVEGKKYYKCMIDISEESIHKSIEAMLTLKPHI